MKTIPLSDLLNHITSLPLRVGNRIEGLKLRNIRNSDNCRVALECGEDDAFYIAHAANVLPELVEALKIARNILADNGQQDTDDCPAFQFIVQVLDRAEKVKVEG